jgi:hypothetical protein
MAGIDRVTRVNYVERQFNIRPVSPPRPDDRTHLTLLAKAARLSPHP